MLAMKTDTSCPLCTIVIIIYEKSWNICILWLATELCFSTLKIKVNSFLKETQQEFLLDLNLKSKI